MDRLWVVLQLLQRAAMKSLLAAPSLTHNNRDDGRKTLDRREQVRVKEFAAITLDV